MKILKNILLVIVSIVFGYFAAEWFGALYNRLFQTESVRGLGAFFNSAELQNLSAGFVPAYIVFLVILFSAFGDKYKYWWMGVLLLPVLWFVIKFDLAHWYFYLALAAIGYLLGWGISKVLNYLKFYLPK